VAESVGDQIDHLISKLPASERGKPLFDTEGGWGALPGLRTVHAIIDPDEQASFQMSRHVAKFYWWSWDIPGQAALYAPSTRLITPSANAYVQIVRWTNDGTATVGPGSATGTVWTCTLPAVHWRRQSGIHPRPAAQVNVAP
jgi:hypothetical protein